ncbi:hypothetical protein U14_00768 [Candidatus Moduliflexus flocculans]|uniref:Uncharacterized protein n=1 Tax=Candidatus Moduliflexus flocculans TaxID=1499966 RepID=A0A0S6VV90_9BACT|nr:hypothetical protein U14_00768 [Candidatus Moduliflexus flocculans]
MLMPKIWRSRHFIFCCSVLLLAAGCGLSEMFGGSNAEKITEPCIELIPSATPTPIPAVVPIIPITPLPGKTPTPHPTPSQSCENAPGIVLICDGKPAEEIPITVITPPPLPTPSVVYYTITVAFASVPPTCGGSVSPFGSVSVPSGANAVFSVTIGACSSFSAYLDSSLFASGTSDTTLTIPNVTSNHSLLFWF